MLEWLFVGRSRKTHRVIREDDSRDDCAAADASTKTAPSPLLSPPTSSGVHQHSTITTIPRIPQHIQHHRRLMELSIDGTSSPPSPSFSEQQNDRNDIKEDSVDSVLPFRRKRSSTYPRRHRNLKEEEDEQQEASNNNIKKQQQQQIVPLYQGWGSHYVDLYVGNPHPQRQTLIVDTGSSTTAFPCSGCSPRKCGRLERYHTDPIYQEARSHTFCKIQCNECYLGNCHQHHRYRQRQQQLLHNTSDIGNNNEECSFNVAY